jgi:antitoxin (DNA-binding transcriptional repressor) of toxin-antitoxin stability system
MQFVSVRDLRSQSASIWKKLADTMDMVITLNGKPIALLTRISENSLEESLAILRRTRAIQAVEAMQVQSKQLGTNRLSLKKINAVIRDVRKNRMQ